MSATFSITLNGNTYTEANLQGTAFADPDTGLVPLLFDAAQDFGKALQTTSATSFAIGTGSKVFVLAADRPFAIGAYVTITSASDATKQMVGTVTAKAGTSLTVNVTGTDGSGTFADWVIQISGPQGIQGPAGSVPLETSTPSRNTAAGAAGSSTNASKGDHTHPAELVVWSTTVTAGNVNATVGQGDMIDSTAAARTFTLPASPADGDRVGVRDYAGTAATNNITIARNGKNIEGLAEDLIIDINRFSAVLMYRATGTNWVVIA